jgi:endoglucanase
MLATNPLAGLPLFVPETDASIAERDCRTLGDQISADLLSRIARQPQAVWLADPTTDRATLQRTLQQARQAQQLPVFVLYNIPGRDSGGHSSGGAASAEQYLGWASDITRLLGDWPAAVIVEPDALAQLDHWPPEAQTQLLQLLNRTLTVLAECSQTAVYLDAGNPDWHPAETMARRLRQAGIDQARGFALNVANFQTTRANISYGQRLSSLLDNQHFIIDTGRNGQGPLLDAADQWCNPPGRALGLQPSVMTASPLIDAYLWVKPPGASDGVFNRGPRAGVFWPEYAIELCTNELNSEQTLFEVGEHERACQSPPNRSNTSATIH